jgi:endonuclease YncB( thermonuclease family)
MTSSLRRAVAATTGVVLALLVASSAQAGGELLFNTARVKQIADGDTPYVDIAGDGVTTLYPIRMTGIQATEIRHPDSNGNLVGIDWCHGLEAKARLSQLTMEKLVQLRGLKSSSSSNGRQLRNVFVENGNDGWNDVQRTLLYEGHALWGSQLVETTHNAEYHALADQAAAAGRNIYDTDYCGSGPSQSAKLKLYVHYDADSDDGTNLNDEYVLIQNNDTSGTVDLSGWHIRDSSLDYYTFPSGATLPAGHRIYLFVGKGTNHSASTSKSYYWGRTIPVFDNPAPAGIGDGAYLLDPDGDFRSWMIYPCLSPCYDPLRGKITVSKVVYDPAGADTAAKEYVQFKSVASSRFYLNGYLIRTEPYTMQPGWGTYLDPGETLTVYMGKGTNTRTRQYMGYTNAVLNNSGDEVDIVTYNAIHITCKAWGVGRCPTH